MSKNSNEKIKKASSIVLATVLFLGTAIGAGFSFSNSISKSLETPNYDPIFKNKLDFSIDVNGDVTKAAKDAQDTIDFMGYADSQVYTIGENRLMIDMPVNSYNDKEGYSLFDNEGLAINDYIKEVENFAISVLTKGTIEFRTQDGQSLFDYGSDGKVEFVQPTFSDPSTSSSHTNLTSSKTDVPVLFSDAKMKFNNGQPYISLVPKNDSIKNELIKWNTWINDTEAGSDSNKDTEVSYAAWFDYDELESYYETLDSSYDPTAGLYSVAFDTDGNVKPEFKPFLISYGKPNVVDVYNNEFKLAGSRTQRETRYFVNAINKSNEYSFDYKTAKTELIISNKSKTIILVASILLLIFIVLSMIFFVLYFGLLGSIGVINLLITTMISLVIFSTVGLQISVISLVMIGIVSVVSIMMSFKAIDIYRNEKDKSKSISNKYLSVLKKVSSYIFSPVLIASSLLFMSGMVMPISIASIFYFITDNIFINYFITLFVSLTILLIFDSIIKFTSMDENKKWNFVTGRSTEATFIKPLFNTNSGNVKKISIYSIITCLVAFFAAIMVGGIATVANGTPINNSQFNGINYSYNIFSTIEPELQINGDVAQNEKPYYDDAVSNVEEIKQTLKNDNVKVKKVSVVRNEVFSIDKSKIKLLVNYGYKIETSKAIKEDQINVINDSFLSFNLKLENNLSLINGKSEKTKHYTNNKMFYEMLISIVILLVVAFVLFTTFFKWGISTSFVASMLFEITSIIAPVVFLFLPFNSLILLPLMFIVILSMVTKIDTAKKIMNNLEDENKWFQLANRQQNTILAGFSSLLIVELLLMVSSGFIIVLPAMIVTLLSLVPVIISSNFIFPYIATKFIMLRKDDKETKNNNDIRNSQDPNVISEEMIEGINI